MAWFKCFIRGESFPGELIGESGLVGFYLTWFVEAADVAAAESQAMQNLRLEPKLAPPPNFKPSDKVRVFFEEIVEMAPTDVPKQQPGFAFYSSESES